MAMGALDFLYRKLGSSYPFAFLMLELQSAFVITAGTIFLFSFYYDAPEDDYLLVGAVAMVLTALAIASTLIRLFPRMRPLSRWIAGKRSPEDTHAAWRAAIDLPLRMIRTDLWVPIFGVVVPTVIVSLFVFDAPWYSFFPLGADVLIALGVAATIALELTLLLTKSILRPVADLHRATHLVAEGRYDEVQVPVTTGDELGELASSFNQMVEGLREREQIREAFGTYLDRDVAEYILSEGFSEEGVDVEVSILFCDVRDFTAFASEASAQQVVAALNRLFEVIVPAVSAEGGHVDKFEGDGLMAVFGAPEPFSDHADRAVRAACEIARRVNHQDEAGELRVGVGVNSGRVIAGSIGGGGRLDFSVIGNAVNLAARG